MSDILSQKEIDALLNELNSGEIDLTEMQETASVVKKYDFKRPSKFAKDHIRTLSIIHDNYAKEASALLTRYLRSPFTMELITIEVLTYRDFNNSISNPSIVSIIDMKPLNGPIILEIPPIIAYAIVDRVLGGFTDPEEETKDFTDIELLIIEGIIQEMTTSFKEPWANIIEIEPALDRIETNPQMAQVTAQTDMVILITYRVAIDEIENFINICIPDLVIDPIISKLTTKVWFSKDEKKKHEELDANIASKLMESKVLLKTILGKTEISFDEIANLQVGDIITLDKNIKENVDVYIDNTAKFSGEIGIHNKKYSIKINNVVEKEKE
jgi:flagellar motor switch protein FliM